MKQLELETEVSELGARLDDLMEENDGLRKGMREILDSVRNQDASSDVKIEAPEIERLLGILDARHLWGSYHPAMGLKNRIEQLEGINSGWEGWGMCLVCASLRYNYSTVLGILFI